MTEKQFKMFNVLSHLGIQYKLKLLLDISSYFSQNVEE